MDYSGTIASADAIKIVLESNRRMIDRVTETMRIAIAHMNSQSPALMKTVPHELLTKSLKPLLSQSTMQAIVKIQSEQIAKISKSLPNISNLYLNDVHRDDADAVLDDEPIEASIQLEVTKNHLISRENFLKFVKFIIKKFVEINIIEPVIKSSFDDFVAPIIQSFWYWLIVTLDKWW